MSKPLNILLAAVEPSGDATGAALFKALKQKVPAGTQFVGCGGAQMAQAGFKGAFPVDAFAVMGFTDVLKALPEGMKRAREIGKLAAETNADVAVFIDGWTFSRVGAKRVREYSPRTLNVKYSAPQIWASRPQRIDFVKKYFDSVLTLLPFEPPYFQVAGVPAEFVGNPNFQSVVKQHIDLDAFRRDYGIGEGRTLVVLPGSRRAEINHLSEVFNETIRTLCEKIDDLQILMPVAPAVEELVREAFKPLADKITFVTATDRFAAFRLADAALAASGTVTTELAISGTPMVVAYKVDDLTYFWAQRVFTTEYATILNIAANREVIPEFLQKDCTADLIVPAVEDLMLKEAERGYQQRAFDRLLSDLEIDAMPAAEKAADAILKLAAEKRS